VVQDSTTEAPGERTLVRSRGPNKPVLTDLQNGNSWDIAAN